MRERNTSVLTTVLPPEERTIEQVVARYQRVAPAVTRFARSLAGNDELRVRLGPRSTAAPGEVVVDPGVFQAAYTRAAPVTPGEVALVSALHEVVHLIATDLEEERPIPDGWLPEDTGHDGEPVSIFRALDEAGGPAAEALFLALEDARQERRHLAGYPGARSVLADLYSSSVRTVLEESGPLTQYALACFLATGGYRELGALQGRCSAQVARALNDAGPFVEAVAGAADHWEVGGLALQLLQVARLHGLVGEDRPQQTAGERRDRDEDHSRAVADGLDRVRLVSPVLRDLEGYRDTRRAGEGVAAARGRKGESELAGDAPTDQLLRISQAPTVYLPSGQGGKLLVAPVPHRFGSFGSRGRESLDQAARRWGVAQRHVSGELFPLFTANQRRGLRSGYDMGDISPHAALFLGAGLYARMFERRSLPSRRSYAVSLLVDGSASMLQPRALPEGRRAPWPLAAATLGAWTLARLCDELQIEFEVALFNRSFAARPDDSERSFRRRFHETQGGLRKTQGEAARRLTRTVNHYLIKSFDERWRSAEDALAGLFWTAAEPGSASVEARRHPDASPPVSMFEKAANVDEYNLSYAAERLAARRSQVRILVVLADGMTRGSVEALGEAVAEAEWGGTMVLGIGVGDDTVQAAYGRNQVVERPDALARAMVEGVRGALRRSLALRGGETWWARAAGERQGGNVHA